MVRYKIIVSYDGTDYAGWQIQPNDRAITNVLQESFFNLFSKQIKIVGASRTDAGVHALEQVATFETDLALSSDKIKKTWNDHLPGDILIQLLEEVDESFHPQYAVRQKTYFYHVSPERPLPFFARYHYYYRYPIDEEKLERALQVFQGTHDFRSFCTGYEKEDTVRTIDSLSVAFVPEINAYRIAIKGPGFLRYMIRRIVGACLEVASRDFLQEDDLKELLEKKNPEHTMPNAPPHGLFLQSIVYGESSDE